MRSNLPSDLLEDFRLEAAEQLPRCEPLLIEFERAPKSAERLRELFRLIHTLKGNLGYVELNTQMPPPQAIEDVLDALRCGAMTFDSLLGDILLLSLDRLRTLLDQAPEGSDHKPDSGQIRQLCSALHALATAPAEQQDERMRPIENEPFVIDNIQTSYSLI